MTKQTSDGQPGRAVTWEPTKVGSPMMRDPVWVYDNWSAYTDGIYEEKIFGGVEDKTRLTEELSLMQLREIVRLKKHGVHFDYYMMNAFWFDPDGAYRKWRQPDWPNGPDRWLAACQEHGLKPGLWFGTNALWKINVASQWRDSLGVRSEDTSRKGMSFYEGGFLSDFMSTLQYWYERGIRLFEFDAAHFDVATAEALKTHSKEEIFSRNQIAFSNALKAFRRMNPDAMLVAFNDFGGDIFTTATPFPFKKPVDLRWLEVFDTLYTGDIRVSDVPMMNFWRSVDLFNDHMTRRYEQSGVPLERADPFFTLSSTWFGYNRRKQAWKGMLLLTAARGSWKKTIYGDLSLLDDEDARWFAKVQQIYASLSSLARTKSFGGIPGEVQPYGFVSLSPEGAVYTIVNPTQEMREVDLPRLSRVQELASPGRVLFRDDGYSPVLKDTRISLGPEQMAVVGFGRYADRQYDLGIERDIVIPRAIAPLQADFQTIARNSIETTIVVPAKGDLRIAFWQRASDQTAPRCAHMKIGAEQNGKPLPVGPSNQERAVTTGISWGCGEIPRQSLTAGEPVTIQCSSSEEQPVTLTGKVYVVEYESS